MAGRTRLQRVLALICLPGFGIAAISLTAIAVGGKNRSGDLVNDLSLLVYSRVSSNVSETGQAQQEQNEESRTDMNISDFLDMPSNTLDLYKRLVVVTAFSSNHFEEGKGIIASVQKYLPQTKILLYDIGMTAEQRSNASKYCNVEVRTFQFDKYPEHVKTLKTFAWKPLIIKEVSQEYDVIMYGDASLRVISPQIKNALKCLLDFPFVDAQPIEMTIISATHRGTMHYLNFPSSRQHMTEWGTIQAGCWLMLANDIMRQKVIQPWVDCALHEECIAPAGATLYNCNTKKWKKYHDGRYIGCHRFDQSALNIILAREFGFSLFKELTNNHKCYEMWTVERKPSPTLHVRTCT